MICIIVSCSKLLEENYKLNTPTYEVSHQNRKRYLEYVANVIFIFNVISRFACPEEEKSFGLRPKPFVVELFSSSKDGKVRNRMSSCHRFVLSQRLMEGNYQRPKYGNRAAWTSSTRIVFGYVLAEADFVQKNRYSTLF